MFRRLAVLALACVPVLLGVEPTSAAWAVNGAGPASAVAVVAGYQIRRTVFPGPSFANSEIIAGGTCSGLTVQGLLNVTFLRSRQPRTRPAPIRRPSPRAGSPTP